MGIFKKTFPTCLQLDAKDCGPACLQIIARHYGNFYEIEYLREITGARKEGTSVYDLVLALEKINLKSLVLQTSYKKLCTVPMPCIVHWKGAHFVVVYKINAKWVYVSDPEIGLVRYSKREFVQGWLGHIKEKDAWRKGICIAIEPSTDFKQLFGASQKKSNYMESLKYIWGFIAPYRKNVMQILLVMLIVTFINALFPIITQSIIDVGINAKDVNFITLMLISTIVLGLSSSLATWVQQAINLHFSARIKVNMVSDYLGHLFKLPLHFFESRLMGDLLQRSYDYDRIEAMIMGNTFNAILGVLYLIVFGGILFAYDTLLFLVYISLSLLYVLWILIFWNVRKKMDIRYFSYLSADHSLWMESLSKVVDIKSYNYGKNQRWNWERIQTGLYKTKVKLLHVDQIQAAGSSFLSTLKNIILIYIAATSVIKGDMTIGMLIAVQYILGQLNMPLENIVMFITSSQMSYISFLRIAEINKAKAEEPENPVRKDLIDFSGNIKFENVYFKYNMNGNFVLKNLAFVIPYGKVTAIVGASGSGKSTVTKLLMQLYLPSSGQISVGNINLTSVSTADWRNRCGVITQESTVFKDTILNNIIFGREFDKEKFLRAVTISNIHEEIEALVSGYNTMLGENGRGLSEGQKQRILFARAIYDNPDYLFIDEVTSSLDSENEHKIISAMIHYMKGKTIVIAAHRLSSVKFADQIVVLKDGSIVETGTHDSLIERQKIYYGLFKTQIATN